MDAQRREWGRTLANRRRARALSQADLADRTGIEQQTISKIERAEISPSDEIKVAICAALRYEVSTIFAMPKVTTRAA
jgi:transcriptional regulator with XRE-family HTH domain